MPESNPHPVDSATRTCCGGIGTHTTACQKPIHPSGGPFPSIRPIECAPWCQDGDGHALEPARTEQICWGDSHYVELSLEEVHVEYYGPEKPQKFWPSIIGPNAYRGYRELPCVYLHFTLHEHRNSRTLDDSCKLTAAEARELAAALVAVADEIDER